MAGEMFVQDNYSGDAAKGADYFTGASLGEVRWTDEHGVEQVRPERVLNTHVFIEHEGYIELGELTVRHMAHHLEMVDAWRVQRSMAAYDELMAEHLLLSTEVQRLRDENETLRQAVNEPVEVFIGADGQRHASPLAAEHASRVAEGIVPRGSDSVRPISAIEAPLPQEVTA